MSNSAVLDQDEQKAIDTQNIWDTFSDGGNFAHNMISLDLRMFAENYSKEEADAIYEELIEAGF